MAITICPHCGSAGRVPDNFVGRKVKCPKCQNPFTAAAAPAAATQAPPPAAVRPRTPAAPAPAPPARRPPAPPPPPVVEDELEVVEDDGALAPVYGDEPEEDEGDRVRSGGGMQYLRAYQYIFEKRTWLNNLLLTGLCYLIPLVGGIAGMGYSYEILEYLHTRGDRRYPNFEFGRFGAYLMRGLWPFLVGLMIAVPAWLILTVFNFALFVALPDLMFRLSTVVNGLEMLLWLGLFFLLMPLLLRAGISGSLDLGASFRFAPDFFKRVGVPAILVYLILMVTGAVVAPLGMMLCCVGIFWAMAFLALVQGHLYYQLYEEYLRRGGTPIPLPGEAAPDEEEPAEEEPDE
jgi:predicted Zn finger-like uncharacterized protein